MALTLSFLICICTWWTWNLSCRSFHRIVSLISHSLRRCLCTTFAVISSLTRTSRVRIRSSRAIKTWRASNTVRGLSHTRERVESTFKASLGLCRPLWAISSCWAKSTNRLSIIEFALWLRCPRALGTVVSCIAFIIWRSETGLRAYFSAWARLAVEACSCSCT